MAEFRATLTGPRVRNYNFEAPTMREALIVLAIWAHAHLPASEDSDWPSVRVDVERIDEPASDGARHDD